ncbi:autotransporter outer membrane beta-barrel domain-containing protein [Martelella lutilitoris]|uniref:Autotransporter outer membrane beta-barrel domain-containing protein n=1 Tax=Martelella lutilitoris TaxID=2583532 RepID=A0A5C4JUT8_9HYPH|nr:autotransporter outer membrane beta-barrel domain-containing protein [Martelella lutilitoris]TNB49156.1 autotransporter outer membrane beta-barrel domain-containing protein [Martelella lutilitoris]
MSIVSVPQGRESRKCRLLASASVPALLGILALGAPGDARADDECGTPSAGATLTCAAGTYSNGITYTGADGLTLLFDNSGINVDERILLSSGTSTSSQPLKIDIKSIGAVTSNTNMTPALEVLRNAGSNGDIVIGIGGSSTSFQTGLSTSPGIRATIADAGSSGDIIISMNDGAIATTRGLSEAILAENFGQGDTGLSFSGGTIDTDFTFSHGLAGLASNGETTINITGGQITTSGYSAYGAYAVNTGSGDAVITMGASGGNAPVIETTGLLSHGLFAENTGSGDAIINISGGSVSTNERDTFALYTAATQGLSHITVSGSADISASGTNNTVGARADAFGSASSLVEMFGGTINTDYWGLASLVRDTSSTQVATARMEGGKIISTTTPERGGGVIAETFGFGDSVAEMHGGIIETDYGFGLNAATHNSETTSTATAIMTGGTITTTAEGGRGVQAGSLGKGATTILFSGGTVTASGDASRALNALTTNSPEAAGDAVANVSGGTIISSGSVNSSGDAAFAVLAAQSGVGNAIINVSESDGAATISSTGSGAFGLFAVNGLAGGGQVNMNGGTVTVSGADSIGVSSYAASGAQAEINLMGGRVTASGDALGAIGFADSTTIEFVENGAATNAAVTIGQNMIVDASGSTGNHAVYNDDDRAGTNIEVVTSGTVTGNAMMGGGNSTFTLAGGSWTDNIYGDFDPADAPTVNQGSDNFIWTGGTLNSGFYGQGGNDTATIHVPNSASFAAAIFDGGEDGGAPESPITSDIDEITFAADNDAVIGANISNWEKFTVDENVSIAFADNSLTLDGYDSGNVNDMGLASILGGATLTAAAAPGQTFTLYGNLANSGLLSMQDGAYGGNIIIAGDYASNGGRLGVDVDFFDLQSDVLTFGGAIDGTTDIAINDVTGENRARFGAILVADTTNATAIDQNEFTVETGNTTASGLFAYSIYYNLTGDPNIGSTPGLYLYANPDEIQPYIPLFEGYQSVLLQMNKLPTLRQRVGKRYWVYDDVAVAPILTPKDEGYFDQSPTTGGTQQSTPALQSVWGRIDGGFSHVDPSSSTLDYRYDLSQFEAQAGVDGLFLDNENGRLIGGLTGHYRTGEARFKSSLGNSKINPDGWGLGGTLTWYGDNGFYTDAQAQATWYSSELKAEDLQRGVDNSDAFGYALSLEAGQQIGLDNDMVLTPQAQLMWSSVDVDSFTGAYSEEVDFDYGDSLTARLGLALEREAHWQDENGLARRGNVYGIANIYHDFNNKTKATVEQAYPVQSSFDDWTGEIGFGGTYDWESTNRLSYGVYGEITASMGFESSSYNYGGNVGFRITW